jgi:dihydrodipicolinate synthase/N-acetylneuraminate lyase
MTPLETIEARRKPGRKVQGMSAALLPYERDGRVAVEAFQKHLTATHRSGLMNAVNMDTGYVNFLSHSEKLEVLGWTRSGAECRLSQARTSKMKAARSSRFTGARWTRL